MYFGLITAPLYVVSIEKLFHG